MIFNCPKMPHTCCIGKLCYDLGSSKALCNFLLAKIHSNTAIPLSKSQILSTILKSFSTNFSASILKSHSFNAVRIIPVI